MGLPIAAVLREQTKEMRVVRRQRAEEKAQKVTVKILFPLLLCIFPALFIVIIGPGAIRIIGGLRQHLTRGCALPRRVRLCSAVDVGHEARAARRR